MEELLGRLTAEFSALAPYDLITVATLAALEGILSVDNALVLAILVRALPEHQRKRALFYGVAGAFAFRVAALVFAAWLMRLWVFKLVGGGYLLYLSMRHLFFATREEAFRAAPKTEASFWRTLLAVELTDVAFSIDSITAAVGMSDKLLIVWLGGVMGILFLRFAAQFFLRLLEILPRMEDLAYQIVFFVGVKLTLESFHYEIDRTTFWTVMGIIAILGASLVYKDWRARREERHIEGRIIAELEAGRATLDDITRAEVVPSGVVRWLAGRGLLRLPERKEPPP